MNCYRCPQCGHDDDMLRCEVPVVVAIGFHADGSAYGELIDFDSIPEPEDEDTMLCGNCDYQGKALAFARDVDFESLAMLIPAGEHWTPRIVVSHEDDGYHWRDLAAQDDWHGPYDSDAEAWQGACIAHEMYPSEADIEATRVDLSTPLASTL